MGLATALIISVLAALVPISILILADGIAEHDYAQHLVQERLSTKAHGIASALGESFHIAERMVISNALDPQVRQSPTYCHESFARTGKIQHFLIDAKRIDRNGTILCAMVPFDHAVSIAGRSWWHDPATRKGLALNGPFTDVLTGKSVIQVSLPIFTPAGQFDGVISTSIDAELLRQIMARQMSGSGASAIVAANGAVLVKTGSPFGDPSPRFDVAHVSDISDASGQRWVYTSSPLSQRLYVVYAEPLSGIFSALRLQYIFSLLSPIIVILWTCLAIWAALYWFVLRWLDRLKRMTLAFAAGDYSAADPSMSAAPRELRALGEELQAMARSISARDGTLRDHVAANNAMVHEVNHRVKNNLQMVMSFLGIQAVRTSNLQARRAITQAETRVGAMATIARLLYDYRAGGEQGEVDFGLLLDQLISQWRNRAPATIALSTDVQPAVLPLDVAVPLSLFALEAVANAQSHAFGRKLEGDIVVSFEGNEQRGVLSVVDNGRGFDVNRASAGLGQELLESYAGQVGGELSIHSSHDFGTVVRLAYPRV